MIQQIRGMYWLPCQKNKPDTFISIYGIYGISFPRLMKLKCAHAIYTHTTILKSSGFIVSK